MPVLLRLCSYADAGLFHSVARALELVLSHVEGHSSQGLVDEGRNIALQAAAQAHRDNTRPPFLFLSLRISANAKRFVPAVRLSARRGLVLPFAPLFL